MEYIRSDRARLQMKDRSYQQKKRMVSRFIRKKRTTDTSHILNEVNIDYDTLMVVLADLRNEGDLRNT
jgi:predicted transcriptional regulator